MLGDKSPYHSLREPGRLRSRWSWQPVRIGYHWPNKMRSSTHLRALAICGMLAVCTSCHRPVSKAPIIDEYRAAVCVPFSPISGVGPHTREWNTPLTLKNGERVIVRGTQSPGGRIELEYAQSGLKKVAADAGDYVYPSDVRLSKQNDFLYVKARGLAGGLNLETWLFKYDPYNQRLVTKQLVTDEALPAECPENVLAN